MKQRIFILLVVVLAFVSCGTVAFEDEKESDDSSARELATKTVTFSVRGTNGEFETSRASTVAKDRFSYLQYWIYDEDYSEVVVSGVQKTTSDDNFGSFSATLAYGTYHVVVVGHNQTSEMVLNDNGMVVIGEDENRLGDTYYGNAEISVKESSSTTTITMQRNTCCVVVTSQGSAAKVGSVEIVVNAYGLDFGVKDGLSSTDTSNSSFKFDFTDEYRKYNKINFLIYFPLPAFNTIYNKDVSVSLTAKDQKGNVLGSAEITGIPAKIGRRVSYARNLWSEEANIDVEVSGDDWEEINGDAL